MAEPAQFFSTIIQATSGVLALVVAVSTVVYSLEMQFREARTRDLHSFLQDELSDVYTHVLLSVIQALESTSEEQYFLEFESNEELATDVIDKETESALSKEIAAHVYLLMNAIKKENIRNFHSITQEQLDIIEHNSEWLKRFFEDEENTMEIYKELTGRDTIPDACGQRGEPYLNEEVFDSDARISEIAGWFKDEYADRPYLKIREDMKGNNIASLRFLFSELGVTVSAKLEQRREGTFPEYEPPMRRVLAIVGVLVVIGIFIPSLFLLTIPMNVPVNIPSLGPWMIFYIQAGILVSVVSLIGYLLFLVLSEV